MSAIIWSVRKLHCYLDGAEFVLHTDHSALQWLLDFKGSNRRLVRWSLELQPYREPTTMEYREGKKHDNVDSFSTRTACGLYYRHGRDSTRVLRFAHTSSRVRPLHSQRGRHPAFPATWQRLRQNLRAHRSPTLEHTPVPFT
jgi:hypothetical protein